MYTQFTKEVVGHYKHHYKPLYSRGFLQFTNASQIKSGIDYYSINTIYMQYRGEQTGYEASCYCCKDMKSSEWPMGLYLVDYRVFVQQYSAFRSLCGCVASTSKYELFQSVGKMEKHSLNMQQESFKLRHGYISIVHSGFLSSPNHSHNLFHLHSIKLISGEGENCLISCIQVCSVMYLRGGNEFIADYWDSPFSST